MYSFFFNFVSVCGVWAAAGWAVLSSALFGLSCLLFVFVAVVWAGCTHVFCRRTRSSTPLLFGGGGFRIQPPVSPLSTGNGGPAYNLFSHHRLGSHSPKVVSNHTQLSAFVTASGFSFSSQFVPFAHPSPEPHRESQRSIATRCFFVDLPPTRRGTTVSDVVRWVRSLRFPRSLFSSNHSLNRFASFWLEKSHSVICRRKYCSHPVPNGGNSVMIFDRGVSNWPLLVCVLRCLSLYLWWGIGSTQSPWKHRQLKCHKHSFYVSNHSSVFFCQGFLRFFYLWHLSPDP